MEENLGAFFGRYANTAGSEILVIKDAAEIIKKCVMFFSAEVIAG